MNENKAPTTRYLAFLAQALYHHCLSKSKAHSLESMAPCTKKIALCLLVKDGKSMTNGFLSMTKAKYKNGIRWRAVLKVVGEPVRDFGTMHEDPYVSATKKMENLGPRITSAEKIACSTWSRNSG